MFTNASGAIRALRLKKGWSQQDLGQRAGVSREAISRIERGQIRGMTIARIELIAAALGASFALQVRWHGAELDRLIDAAHASLQQSVAELLTALGWIVRTEVSFNHYGDRGRADIVAFQPTLRILLMVEIKSALGDLQDTVGRLDVKTRIGRKLAGDAGWSDVAVVIPVLVIGDSRAARKLVAAHGALFGRFGTRGRVALAWLRRPSQPWPTGLLWFAERQDSHRVTNSRVHRSWKRPDSRST